MKDEKSYTEIMKTRAAIKKAKVEKSMLDIYIQMILDEAMFKREKSILEEKINEAIDTNDKILFMELSKRYKDFVQHD